MFKLADRVKQSSITTGLGSVILQDTYGGFTSFADAIGDGNSTFYTIENNSNYEIGIGTYSLSTNSLSRDNILKSSNSNNKIYLDGLSIVFCTYPAERAVFLDDNGYISAINSAGILFPDNTVQVTASSGSSQNQNKSYITINSNTVLSSIYDVIFANCSINSINITLPSSIGNGGAEIMIKKIGTQPLNIYPALSQTIDGKAIFSINYAYEAISLISDNTNWYIF